MPLLLALRGGLITRPSLVPTPSHWQSGGLRGLRCEILLAESQATGSTLGRISFGRPVLPAQFYIAPDGAARRPSTKPKRVVRTSKQGKRSRLPKKSAAKGTREQRKTRLLERVRKRILADPSPCFLRRATLSPWTRAYYEKSLEIVWGIWS